MLDLGRTLEAVPDQAAPLLEIVGSPERDRVILQGLPAHEQPVAARLFDGALQLQAVAALSPPEERLGLGDAGLELRFHAGLHVDLRDFEDHAWLPCVCSAWPAGARPADRS